MSVWVFISGILVGLVPLIFGISWWQNRHTRLVEENATQAAEFATAISQKDAETLQLEAQQKKSLEDQSAAHSKNIERLREWLGRGLQGEGISRQHLVQACETLGVSGFVATNVCFVAHRGSTPYIHQLDHVIVADSMLFVIEAKHWKGRIFHRHRFEDDSGPFSVDALPMFDDVGPQERYVLKIEDDGSMLWLPDGRTPEPAKQVQQQAIQFKKFLTTSLGQSPGNILNCVFYSHPSSNLQGGARTFGKYTWVTQTEQLLPVLEEMQHQRRTMDAPAVPVGELHGLITSLGADIVGVGRYANTWQSVFPLPRQKQPLSQGPSSQRNGRRNFP